MLSEVFMMSTMMDSTDFEEHLLLNALEDPPSDHHHEDLATFQPPTKTMSTVSAHTATTVDMMDEEDIDNFFFEDAGVEMVIDEDAKPPARIIEENHAKKKPASKKGSKKIPKNASARSPAKKGDVPVRVGMPGKFDVLCGQSRICASHTGNRRFQVVLDIFAPRYDDATSKQEKMSMTKDIVASIHQAGGRFLKYKDGQWEEISDVTARDKASHALRTKVASWKRQQQEKKNEIKKACRPTHRRGGIQRSRRSSDSSILTSASDIVTESFDGNDADSANVMAELIKNQRQFYHALSNGEHHPLKN
jgi:hypothetical protein